VTGTFSSACIAEGGAISKSAHAEFAVVCKSPPCVEVTASGPEAACPGAPVTIAGTAKNCSLDAELIVVTVNGTQAYSNSVAAGQTINWSLNTTMPAECTAGQNSSFAVVATGSGDCGTRHEEHSVLVRCKDKPCVELTADRNPPRPAPATRSRISGTVKNCSLDPETIVVTINGQQVFNQVVAAGATAQYSQGFTMPACTAGANVDYVVHATATGDCLPVANDEETVSVLCKNPPCVELTADRNPASACPGDAVTISARSRTARSPPETIVVTVNGEQVFSGVVAAGATQNYSKSTVMPPAPPAECAGRRSSPLRRPTGDLVGRARSRRSRSPARTRRASDVTAQANKAAAVPERSRVIVSGVVKNCGTDAADLHGHRRRRAGLRRASSPAAPSRRTSAKSSMGACVAGNNVTWDIVAPRVELLRQRRRARRTCRSAARTCRASS
jgi:sulfur carrier protein ThiS